MANTTTQEDKVTGASYIITFYTEVMNLTHASINYSNVLLYVENTAKADDAEALEDETQRNVLIENAQTVRYYAQKAYIMYKTIMQSLGITEDKKIVESMKPIKTEFIIDREKLETFVVNLNAALIKDVVKDLLQTSRSLVDNLYSNEPNTKPK